MVRGPECESPIEEMVKGMSSGQAGLCMEDMLTGQWFTTPRNGLILRGDVFQSQQGFTCQSIENEENKRDANTACM